MEHSTFITFCSLVFVLFVGYAAGQSAFITAPTSRGPCNDSQDLGIFVSKNASFHDLVMNCAAQCAAEAKCTAACLVNTIGLTPGCAACWAADVVCTAQNCFGPCLRPSSKACEECSIKYCQAALLKCGGVNKHQIPNQ